MALKRDLVYIWLSCRKENGQLVLGALALLQARLKEVKTRLESAANKKVKGNRLKSLDLKDLDASTLAYAEDFASAAFRIADLYGFGASLYAKAPWLENQVYGALAGWLKDNFAGCEFVLFYDRHELRTNTLNSWARRQQLNLRLEEEGFDSSVLLQSAAFLAGLALGQPENPALSGPYEKSARLVDMDKKWLVLPSLSLYAKSAAQNEQALLAGLLKDCPSLITEGILEKWIKKGTPKGFYSLLKDLLENGADLTQLQSMQPSKIVSQKEALQQSLQKAAAPLDEEAWRMWIDKYESHIASLPGMEADPTQLSGKRLMEKSLELLDLWLDNPKQFQPEDGPVYLCGQEEGVVFLQTALMLWLQQADSKTLANLGFLKKESLPYGELRLLVESLSAQKPLPALYASDALIDLLHSWSVETNRFLPLFSLKKAQEAVLGSARIPESAAALRLPKEDHFTFWFSQALLERLDENDLAFLSQGGFSVQETRLLAKALSRGLHLEKAVSFLLKPNASIYLLVRPYLYPRKVQNYLSSIHDKELLKLLSRPQLSLANMQALAALYEEGIPADWLEVNLHGGISQAKILALKEQFPFGRLPALWQACYQMPDKLFAWCLQKAGAAHPKMSEEALKESLIFFNVRFLALLLNKPKA